MTRPFFSPIRWVDSRATRIVGHPVPPDFQTYEGKKRVPGGRMKVRLDPLRWNEGHLKPWKAYSNTSSNSMFRNRYFASWEEALAYANREVKKAAEAEVNARRDRKTSPLTYRRKTAIL